MLFHAGAHIRKRKGGGKKKLWSFKMHKLGALRDKNSVWLQVWVDTVVFDGHLQKVCVFNIFCFMAS